MTAPLPDPDAEHERALDAAVAAYLASTDEVERVNLWADFLSLHAKRSPAKVREMERAAGLT